MTTKLPAPPHHVNGYKTRALIVVVLLVMLVGYALLAWQNFGLAQQGAVTKSMVERIVDKKTRETIEQRIAPLEAKTDKADARADRAEQRQDRVEKKTDTVSKKQRHVERQVKPLLPLAQDAVVEKILEEHAEPAPTPETMTAAPTPEPESKPRSAAELLRYLLRR